MRDWDFNSPEKILLSGEWKFKWNEDSEVFSEPDYIDTNWDSINVPLDWTKQTGTPVGFGWLRLKVLLNKNNKLGIYIPRALTACELYINGQKLFQRGRTGKSIETYSPYTLPGSLLLPDEEEIQIAWKISNFIHSLGGAIESPFLSTETRIKRYQWNHDFITILFLGFFLIAAFFHLLLFFFRKKETTNLYVALLYLVLSLRVLASEFLLAKIFLFSEHPFIFGFSYFLKFYTLLGIILFYILYITKLYPGLMAKKIFYSIYVCLFVFALCYFFPPGMRESAIRVMQVSMVILGFFVLYILLRAFFDKLPYSGYLFISTCIALIFSLCEVVLSFINPSVDFNLLFYGFILHLLLQTAMLLFRFSQNQKITESFNQTLQEEVERKTGVLIKQNREIERANLLLTKKTEELYEANEEKSRFFINIAHDARTPLTLIGNYLNKYISETGENEDILVVKRNIDRLQKDMVDYLDAEKLRRGYRLYEHHHITDASQVVQRKLELLQRVIDPSWITFEQHIMKNVLIQIDPTALNRIIDNLIENALKYSGNKGRITIGLRKEAGLVCLMIEDNGIGIAPEQIKRITEPFYQISHRKQNNQGLGMGLSIVKMILSELGGELSIRNRQDQGTRVKVLFQAPSPGALPGTLVNIDTLPLIPGVQKSLAKLKPGGLSYDKNRFTILIVEDSYDLIAFLQMHLKDKYNVYYAFNGKEALGQLSWIPRPDVILSDIMMDEMDGYNFLDALSASGKYSSIPLLFLTAKGGEKDKLRGLRKGAVDFISKPFLIEEILAKVDSIIETRKQYKEQTIQGLEQRLSAFLREKKDFIFDELIRKYHITPKEMDVILLLRKGLEYKEIGAKLNYSLSAIKKRVGIIYRKCEVPNKTKLFQLIDDLKP